MPPLDTLVSSVAIERAGVEDYHRIVSDLLHRLECSLVAGCQRQVLPEVLVDLDRHIQAQLPAEEAWMRQEGCPDLAGHVQDHDRLRSLMTYFQDRLDHDTSQGRIILAEEIRSGLGSWLDGHRLTWDGGLFRWWQERQAEALAGTLPAAALTVSDPLPAWSDVVGCRLLAV